MSDIQNIQKLFSGIKNQFIKRKKIDIEGADIHIEMEPTSSEEEAKVLAACNEFDGAAYVEALKKHSLAFAIKKINDIDLTEEVSYIDDDGERVSMSSYLFLVKQITEWPTALRDVLFEAYQNMQEELEENVRNMTKFQRFQIQKQQSIEKESSESFRKIEEPEEELTENEKLNKKVKDEIENADMLLNQAEIRAENGQK